MASRKKTWNGLGNSAIVDTHQYAHKAQNKPGRNRYKCVHYDPETTLCEMNNIHCVGPSNSFCQDYCTNPSKAKKPPYRTLRTPKRPKPVTTQKATTTQKPTPKPAPPPQPSAHPKPKFDPSSVSVGMMIKHINACKGKVSHIDRTKKEITLRMNGIDTTFSFPDAFTRGILEVLPPENGKK